MLGSIYIYMGILQRNQCIAILSKQKWRTGGQNWSWLKDWYQWEGGGCEEEV
jgi:hypothetical protein